MAVSCCYIGGHPKTEKHRFTGLTTSLRVAFLQFDTYRVVSILMRGYRYWPMRPAVRRPAESAGTARTMESSLGRDVGDSAVLNASQTMPKGSSSLAMPPQTPWGSSLAACLI